MKVQYDGGAGYAVNHHADNASEHSHVGRFNASQADLHSLQFSESPGQEIKPSGG